MSDGVKITLPMTFIPGAADEVVKMISSMLGETKTRPGFRNCQVHRSKVDPNKIIMIEEWDAIQDYQNYIAWRTERGDMEALGKFLAGPVEPDFWEPRDVAAG